MKYKLVSGFIGTFLFGNFVQAKYIPLESCGVAKVVSGDACSNVKIHFDLSNCSAQKNALEAKKVVCDGPSVKARLTEGEYRYEAQFVKQDDGWGTVEWKILGAVKQWKKEEKPKEIPQDKAVKPAVLTASQVETKSVSLQPEVVQSPGPVPSVVVASVPLKFSGFFDFRFSSYGADQKVTNPENGFGVEDGAFYVNYESGKLSMLLDIPFRRYKNVDNPSYSGNQANASDNGNFIFGADKVQAYGKYKLNDHIVIDAGQFDTLFGLELNDSKDRYFSRTGLIYDQFLPVTHTGGMVEFVWGGSYLKGFSANPNNKGSLGSSSNGDEQFEYGASAGYTNEFIRGQVGYLVRPINKANGISGGRRELIDLLLGGSYGRFSIDFEYARLQDDSKNTLTASDASDSEDAAEGFVGIASYQWTEAMSSGVRYEYVKNDPAQLVQKNVQSWAVGFHYKVQPALELRTEYIGYKLKNIDNTEESAHRFSVATLFMF